MADLRQRAESQDWGTYELKVQARKAFRSLRHRNFVQMAEVFTEMYIASFRTPNPEGWFFKTHKWWDEEHGLSREVVDTAREKLRNLEILEERHWVSNRVEYRLMPARVIEVIFPEGLDEGSSLRESRNLDRGKPANQNAVNPRTHKREEEEIKKESGRPPSIAFSDMAARVDTTPRSPRAVGHGDTKGSESTVPKIAHEIVDLLNDGLLEAHGDCLRPGQVKAYRRQAASMIASLQDLNEEQAMTMFERIVERVVDRWPHFKSMPLDTALRDVLDAEEDQPTGRWRAKDGAMFEWHFGRGSTHCQTYDGHPDGAEVATPDGRRFIRQGGQWKQTQKSWLDALRDAGVVDQRRKQRQQTGHGQRETRRPQAPLMAATEEDIRGIYGDDA